MIAKPVPAAAGTAKPAPKPAVIANGAAPASTFGGTHADRL
jgi:hypothetical protein